VILAVVAAAAFVTLLAARPLVIGVVVTCSVIVGTGAGLAVWRRRSNAGKLPRLGDLVRGGSRDQVHGGRDQVHAGGAMRRPAPSTFDAAGGGGWLVAALIVVGLIVVALVDLKDSPRSLTPPLKAAKPAAYDGTATFDSDNDQWSVRETMDVPLPAGSVRPASLSGKWAYEGPGTSRRVAVYGRSRTIPADVSFWPFRYLTNVIEIPRLTLAVRARNGATPRASGKERTFFAADGSSIRLTGPRRLIGDTTPAAAKRTKISRRRETVELKLTGLRYDRARQEIEADIANGIGRSALYTWAVKYGPIPIGIVFTTAITFFVNRALKRRFGDGSAVAVPAASVTP
jgi:hypothetical protein